MVFRIGVLAYTLFIGVQRLACPPAWASQTIATVRWKLMQGAGRMVQPAGQMVVKRRGEAEARVGGRVIRQRGAARLAAPSHGHGRGECTDPRGGGGRGRPSGCRF